MPSFADDSCLLTEVEIKKFQFFLFSPPLSGAYLKTKSYTPKNPGVEFQEDKVGTVKQEDENNPQNIQNLKH